MKKKIVLILSGDIKPQKSSCLSSGEQCQNIMASLIWVDRSILSSYQIQQSVEEVRMNEMNVAFHTI